MTRTRDMVDEALIARLGAVLSCALHPAFEYSSRGPQLASAAAGTAGVG